MLFTFHVEHGQQGIRCANLLTTYDFVCNFVSPTYGPIGMNIIVHRGLRPLCPCVCVVMWFAWFSYFTPNKRLSAAYKLHDNVILLSWISPPTDLLETESSPLSQFV